MKPCASVFDRKPCGRLTNKGLLLRIDGKSREIPLCSDCALTIAEKVLSRHGMRRMGA